MFDEWFDPLVLRLIELLKKALPHAADEDLFWGYHFTTGALMLTLARTGRIDKLSGGLAQSEDFAAVKQRMARFMAAGIREITAPRVGRPPKNRDPPPAATDVALGDGAAHCLPVAAEKAPASRRCRGRRS